MLTEAGELIVHIPVPRVRATDNRTLGKWLGEHAERIVSASATTGKSLFCFPKAEAIRADPLPCGWSRRSVILSHAQTPRRCRSEAFPR